MDGFRGLVENRFIKLDDQRVSGILTQGGTILGTSRDKPHKMEMGGKSLNMMDVAVANARAQQIDCLVCLGGNGTQKNAYNLSQHGLNVVTLPKTIDNDVAETDITFGFDTALSTATEAIDRLHTTATSHNRIIVCELMGHNAGWLALGSGIAGGADVILIPEIPYDLELIAQHLVARRQHGKRFSIIAVAEGAKSKKEVAKALAAKAAKKEGKKKDKETKEEAPIDEFHYVQESLASRIARNLQERTGMEARTTSLGHVQRGGSPTAGDRLLCTQLGTLAGQLLYEGHYNVMVSVKGDHCEPVDLAQVAGVKKVVPRDHPWIKSALLVETCLGDTF